MNLSVFVSESINVQDIFGSIFKKIATLLPFTVVFEDEANAKEAEQKPIDNNSPPAGETLGVSVGDTAKTKDGLA